MRKELIEFLRVQRRIPNELTDDDLERLVTYLNDLPRLPDEFRIANLIELKELRKAHWPMKPEPFLMRSAGDFLWLWRCELFFVEGLSGPCCIWARAIVEYELQEMCISNPQLRKEFENERTRKKGKNPGIDWCMNHLRDSLFPGADTCCATIANNGDFVVHHRLDGMKCDQSVQDMLIKFNLTKKIVNVPGFDIKRALLKAARPEREEIMARESMKNLYEFESKRPNPWS